MKKALELSLLSTDYISKLDLSKYLIIWPIASIEQHGPHLPLGTDSILLNSIVNGVLEKLDEDFKGLFLPIMSYGKSPEHLAFPGTVSLQSTTILALIEDVVSSLAIHGAREFVFLNGHGGNCGILDSITFDLRHKYGVKAYHLFVWEGKNIDELSSHFFPNLQELEIHAASIETSLMLFLYPELVGDIPDGNSTRKVLEPISYGWSSLDFGSNGVIGDPEYASVQAGKEIYHFTVESVCEKLSSIQK